MLRLRRVRRAGQLQVVGAHGQIDFDESFGNTALVEEHIAVELAAAGRVTIPAPEDLCPGDWIVRRRSGLGDVLCMSAVIREVVVLGGRVEPMTHRHYQPIFNGLDLGRGPGWRPRSVLFTSFLEHHPGRKGRSAASCMGDYWNLEIEDARPWLVLTGQERAWARERVHAYTRSHAPVVALFTHAGWETRTYRGWRHVAKGLADAGVVVVGFDEEILPCCSKAPNRLTVRELAAFLGAVDLVLSGDSGPMHLSQAVGTPAVTVFCATGAAGSIGERYDVLALEPEGMRCWPCWGGLCQVGPLDVPGSCVNAVAPGDVVKAVLQRLSRPAQITSEVNSDAG